MAAAAPSLVRAKVPPAQVLHYIRTRVKMQYSMTLQRSLMASGFVVSADPTLTEVHPLFNLDDTLKNREEPFDAVHSASGLARYIEFNTEYRNTQDLLVHKHNSINVELDRDANTSICAWNRDLLASQMMLLD